MSSHPTDPRNLVMGMDENGHLVATTTEPVCDFCLSPGPKWEYPAGWVDIEGHHTIQASDDEWAACEVCSRLIENESVEALVQRCCRLQREQLADSEDVVFPPPIVQRRQMRETLTRFLGARTGPRRPWTPA